MALWLKVVASLVLICVVALAALTVEQWFPPMLAFLDVHGDRIQAFGNLLQIVLWVAEGLVVVFTGWTIKQAFRSTPKEPLPISSNKATFHEQVKIDGDFVNGPKVTIHNAGKQQGEE